MTLRNCFIFLTLFGNPALAMANEEIRVTLFGQPCTMTGPYSKSVLKNIHEISPEKVAPDMSIEAMKKVRTQTTQLKGVHALIESYRDHLRKRLTAKIAFEEALQQAKKKTKTSQKLDVVLANVREHIPAKSVKGFETEARAMLERTGGEWTDAFLIPLREKYQSMIEANPEEEFHKAIRAAKVQYICAFDEGVDEGDEDEADDEPAPAATPTSAASKKL